jgi:hypothetical protein
VIISFSQKFIFFKPIKMAGSSVEEVLHTFCDPTEDVVTPDSHRPTGWNHIGDKYRFFNHMRRDGLMQTSLLTQEEFERDFFKITICRNPWDHQVSSFWHVARLEKRYKDKSTEQIEKLYQQDFYDFIVRICRDGKEGQQNISREFYFYENGDPYYDNCLRFEHLQADFDDLCKQFGWTQTTLPRLKSDTRLLPHPYQAYYNDETREIVWECFKQMALHFGYTF